MKQKCPFCHLQRDPRSVSRTIRRIGRYFRKSDGQHLSRFWCARCFKSFSASTISPLRGQKKRQLNRVIVKLNTAAVSQRESARVLGIDRKTIARKLRFAGKTAYATLLKENLEFPVSSAVEFDDLETFIHTKLKPISMISMVESKSRRILGLRIAEMPAKGKSAALSVKKYGKRSDHRKKAREELFKELQARINPHAVIRSDSSPHYPPDVKRFFPNALHETVPGGRAAIVGQGELKKKGFDPIFSLNHTFAMFRDHLKRLTRRTWCTTKRLEDLEMQLALYALEHNQRLKLSTA